MISFIKNYKLEILVFVFFLLTRVPDLGHDSFNTDVWKWKTRSYDFSSGVFNLRPELTIQKYHPGVTLMWLGTLGIKVANVYIENFSVDSVKSIFVLDAVQKWFIVASIALGMSAAFYVIRKLFGYEFALFSIALMSFEPFFVGLSRVMHLEGMMSVFMLTSALWLYYFLDSSDKRHRLFISALFASLAILTKTSALYMIPFTFLVLVTHSNIRFQKVKELFKFSVKNFLLWLSAVITFSILFWPALWSVPVDVFNVLYRGIFVIGVDTEHIQYYFGRLVEDPGYLFYIVVLLYKSSVYLLVGIALLFAVFKKLQTKEKRLIGYLLLFALFYTIELTLPSKKLDRYILPAMLALSLVVSFSLFYCLQKVKVPNKLKYLLFFIPAVALLTFIHPDYFSYYNPMYGGLKKGIFVIEPKWMIGTPEVVEFFKVEAEKEKFEFSDVDESFEELINTKRVGRVLTVAFPEKYYTQIWPFFRELGGWAVIEDLGPFAKNTNYFVYPVWEDLSVKETRVDLVHYYVIKVRGVPIYNVYKRVIPQNTLF
ncbi:hypothetical protein A2415_00645 [candidate division WWE3 bacterium RIFOXYC1_FULL_39_7]|uniref:Glycosyltransferase RgtA/B/C/D-like domain-containing protein n=2 Tax=Katanobacteria TaxID=422282 RepID=A0A1F4X6Q5_UNCKA|nr:MAG: hypothetical protein A2415_00645 [candidate division WWE3 bacterium RIFOXYC1_FULL_39_7]OGC77346.1 MAG: hypothetical protein A2619_04910 [candidate division WWE3 bacterium RIFOXYD1_FULL_39_9]